eukprot:scpid49596/ scgid5012/ 
MQDRTLVLRQYNLLTQPKLQTVRKEILDERSRLKDPLSQLLCSPDIYRSEVIQITSADYKTIPKQHLRGKVTVKQISDIGDSDALSAYVQEEHHYYHVMNMQQHNGLTFPNDPDKHPSVILEDELPMCRDGVCEDEEGAQLVYNEKDISIGDEGRLLQCVFPKLVERLEKLSPGIENSKSPCNQHPATCKVKEEGEEDVKVEGSACKDSDHPHFSNCHVRTKRNGLHFPRCERVDSTLLIGLPHIKYQDQDTGARLQEMTALLSTVGIGHRPAHSPLPERLADVTKGSSLSVAFSDPAVQAVSTQAVASSLGQQGVSAFVPVERKHEAAINVQAGQAECSKMSPERALPFSPSDGEEDGELADEDSSTGALDSTPSNSSPVSDDGADGCHNDDILAAVGIQDRRPSGSLLSSIRAPQQQHNMDSRPSSTEALPTQEELTALTPVPTAVSPAQFAANSPTARQSPDPDVNTVAADEEPPAASALKAAKTRKGRPVKRGRPKKEMANVDWVAMFTGQVKKVSQDISQLMSPSPSVLATEQCDDKRDKHESGVLMRMLLPDRWIQVIHDKLHENKYNIDQTIKALEGTTFPAISLAELFSDQHRRGFLTCLSAYGKDPNQLAIATESSREKCMDYYYMWKRSPEARAAKQTKDWSNRKRSNDQAHTAPTRLRAARNETTYGASMRTGAIRVEDVKTRSQSGHPPRTRHQIEAVKDEKPLKKQSRGVKRPHSPAITAVSKKEKVVVANGRAQQKRKHPATIASSGATASKKKKVEDSSSACSVSPVTADLADDPDYPDPSERGAATAAAKKRPAAAARSKRAKQAQPAAQQQQSMPQQQQQQ